MHALPTSALLAAASAAAGMDLRDPADLGGSDRSTVLRCQRRGGGTVVVKSYPRSAEGRRGFAAEAAGLAFTASASAGPRLLAADASIPLVVMTDLGTAPSLADLLLGESAEAAARALLSWAGACGRLAVHTARRQQELAALRAAYRGAGQADGAAPSGDVPAAGAGPSGDPASGAAPARGVNAGGANPGGANPGAANPGGERHWLRNRIDSAPGLAAQLGITPPLDLAADLAEVASILGPGGYEVFSPGDICPDNNLVTAAGIRFVDFEDAEFHSVFLDAAYLRMPFSTCWCVLRLPADIAAAAELAYRTEVSAVFPELAADAVWQAGVLRAVAAWTIHAMTYLVDRSMAAETRMNELVSEAPGARQLLRYRWQMLVSELESAAVLPALAAFMRSLLAATEHWHVPGLPVYPAFRPLRPS